MVYGAAILEREKFLRSLYEQLDDLSKSKILLNKKLVKVEHRDNGISVQCADGTEFEGDFVVGADGIHSRVRLEMQRIARNIGPPGLLDRDKYCMSVSFNILGMTLNHGVDLQIGSRGNCASSKLTRPGITSEYNCIFGISSPNHSLIPGTVTITREIEHSSLLFVSSDHRPQWFFISKTPQKHHYPSIPRVTKSQMEAQVKKFENFKLTEEVSLRELVDTELRLSYQALEEASHEVWTYGRIVCLGDAMHKMTPNVRFLSPKPVSLTNGLKLGQGGNQAIESCAALTNCLMELSPSAQKPSSQSLETAFLKYQNLRKKRAKTFVDISGLTTRDEALDNLKHTLRFLYLPMLNAEQMTSWFLSSTKGIGNELLMRKPGIQTEMYSSAPKLDHLPIPRRIEGNKIWSEGEGKVMRMNEIMRAQ